MIRTATTIAAAVLLSACGTMAYVDNTGTQAPARIVAECEFEAIKATAGIRNAAEAGWMQGEITNRCMALKGYPRTVLKKGA